MTLSSTARLALRIAAVLWVVWGLVHLLAGVLVLGGTTASGFQAIADGVDPAALALDYPAAVGAVLDQHAWNLAWFGLATIIGAIFVWRANMTAIWVTGMVGGLADLGYLVFLDLPGYVNFVPGTIMTFVSGAAIVLSFPVWIRNRNA
ncbi:hypothetical protein [Pseudaestuariivita atlantica]|uniref:DUF2127 domain-containing protein n=1 Tax=Pseudaestuariivita atlantica TaxID=1317121 RepID=A0A0L1JT35_9RHOB|nr:hypothetical protein [Pseudaestuariivita atlantica]KNG94915.1 hypothetical protein ATO11_05985 [Pseudaestuariivita atlantica]